MKKYVEKNRNLREPLRIVSEDKFLKNICLWCDISLLNMPKNKFCSKPCAHEYRLRSDMRYMRRCVYLRDKGICSNCKTDCDLLFQQAQEVLNSSGTLQLFLFLKEKGFTTGRIKGFLNRKQSLWDAHHLISIPEGGGGCGLEGMSTLCVACHRRTTKKQRNIFDFDLENTLF